MTEGLKILGGQVKMWGSQYGPMAEIGIIDMPKTVRGGGVPPYPPSSTIPALMRGLKLATSKIRINSRHDLAHGLPTPGKEIAFTEQPKIHSHSQIFRYGRSIFCLPQRPKFSDFFALCLHWVSVVRDLAPRYLFHYNNFKDKEWFEG